MIITPGEKVHVIQKRLFENDLRRHFIGEVTEAGNDVIRVQGYSFVFERGSNQYVRQPEMRERIISLVSGDLIINILPQNAKVDKASYTIDKDQHLCVTDGESFCLDINEFSAKQ